MDKAGEMVSPDGSVEELERPAEEKTQVDYGIPDHLRAIVAIAKHEAALYRDSDPTYARRMAVIRTKCEEALLYALFGDRVA